MKTNDENILCEGETSHVSHVVKFSSMSIYLGYKMSLKLIFIIKQSQRNGIRISISSNESEFLISILENLKYDFWLIMYR